MLKHFCYQYDDQENLALEFGVFSGQSISVIRSSYSGPVFGFDSFDGLPEFWREGYDVGHFKAENIPNIDGVKIVVGLFQDTLKNFLNKLQNKIKIVHFDADLYSSTIYCLESICDYLHPECLFIFDEYHNYPGWEQHEYKAFNEWLQNNPKFSATKLAEVESDEQVAFLITINDRR
jgi:hypothetical protein